MTQRGGWRSIGIAPVGNLIFVASESLDRGRAVSTPNTAATFVEKSFCSDKKYNMAKEGKRFQELTS